MFVRTDIGTHTCEISVRNINHAQECLDSFYRQTEPYRCRVIETKVDKRRAKFIIVYQIW